MGKKRIIALSALLALSIIGATAASLAWFDPTTKIQPGSNLVGVSEGAYFAYGDGTDDDYFGIETPRQLYNLAWLQYLGLINKVSETENDESYFELANDLDMTGWVLPPIGTPDHPFMGHFNGNGHTIANLTISDAIEEFSAHPDSVSTFDSPHILGLFGVVGPYYGSNKSYASQTDAISNLLVSGITIKPTTTTALTGLVAGYVNGPISRVGASDAIQKDGSTQKSTFDFQSDVKPYTAGKKIDGNGFSSISEFGTIGYAESPFVGHAKKTKTTMKGFERATNDNLVVQESGDNAGWGGSIDMETTYNGLRVPWDSYSSMTNDLYCPEFGSDTDGTGIYSYPATATQTITNGVAGETTLSDETIYTRQIPLPNGTTYNSQLFTTRYRNDRGLTTAQYTLSRREGNDDYMYIYGENDITVSDLITKTTTTNTDQQAGLYRISATQSGNTYYLTYNNGNIGYTNSSAQATLWIYQNNHLFYQQNSNGSSSSYYYISDDNGKLALTAANASANAATISYDSSTSRFYIAGSPNKYICYYSGWVFASDGIVRTDHYQIKSGDYYITVRNTNPGQTPSLDTPSTTAPQNKTYWHLDEYNCLYVLIGTEKYYLGVTNNNGDLTLSNSLDDSNKMVRNGDYIYRSYTTTVFIFTVTRYNCLEISNSATTATSGSNNSNSGSKFTFSTHTVQENVDFDEAVSTSTGTSYRDIQITNTGLNYTFHTQPTYFPLRQETTSETVTSSTIGYRFYSTYNQKNHYLVFDTTVPNNLGYVTEEDQATVWVTNGNYFSPQGKKSFYLAYSNATLCCAEITPSATNAFTWVGGRLRVGNSNNSYRYIYFVGDSSTWGATNTQNSANVSRSDVYKQKKTPTGVPMETNTGYIIGGADYESLVSAGTIRVSRYAKSSNLSSINTIYTIDGTGIKTTSAADWGEDSPYTSSLAKFTDVYEGDSNIYGLHFMDSEMLYGLNSQGKDQSVYAEYAIINGIEYYDDPANGKNQLEFPQNCIDFNLKEKGYINFIAGTYFPNNNCFFTISEIQRDPVTSAIVKIRNIRSIYTNASQSTYSNVYLYDDDTYSVPYKFSGGEKVALDDGPYTPYSTQEQLPSGYSLKFNCNWIDTLQSGIKTDASYYRKPFYFEIPMNSGEYCMGSPHFNGVETASGAYLMYLDIGANAAKMSRTSITEYIEEITKSYDYPLGLALVAAGTSTSNIDAFNSFCVLIDEENKGIVTISKTSGTAAEIVNTDGSHDLALGFSHDSINVSVANKSGNPAAEIATSTTTTQIKRVTYYDYNLADEKATKIIVTKKTVDGVNQTPTSERYYYTSSNKEWVPDNDLVLFNDQGYRINDLNNLSISDVSGNATILAFKNIYLSTGTLTISYNLEGSMVRDGIYQYFTVSGFGINVVYTDSSGATDLTDRIEIVSVVSTYNTIAIAFRINGNEVLNQGQILSISLSV